MILLSLTLRLFLLLLFLPFCAAALCFIVRGLMLDILKKTGENKGNCVPRAGTFAAINHGNIHTSGTAVCTGKKTNRQNCVVTHEDAELTRFYL